MIPVALHAAHRGCQLFRPTHFHAVHHMRDLQGGGSLSSCIYSGRGARCFHNAIHWRSPASIVPEKPISRHCSYETACSAREPSTKSLSLDFLESVDEFPAFQKVSFDNT